MPGQLFLERLGGRLHYYEYYSSRASLYLYFKKWPNMYLGNRILLLAVVQAVEQAASPFPGVICGFSVDRTIVVGPVKL